MATVVTSGGLAIIPNRIRGTSSEPIYIGWGTGAGTAAVGDTTLFTEKAADISAGTGTRITGTSSSYSTGVAGDTWRLQGTYTASGSGTITNAGCFDAATITAGTLFVKGDFTGIGLASNDAIAFDIRVSFG